MVRRGEIWWYEPPHKNARPHLIMSRTEVIPYLSDVLAIPASSTVRNIPTEVFLSKSDGMPRDCVLNADSMGPVGTVYLTTRITSLEPDRMSEVCEAMRIATGC